MPEAIRLLNYDALKLLLPARPRDSHKGDFGHVLVLGGDQGMGGAALLAAEAAARSGAGLSSVATRPAHVAALLQRRPELMVRGIDQATELDSLLARATVLVVGPGLGQSAWARDCLGTTLQHCYRQELPLVLDADALNWLAKDPQLLQGNTGKWILTPHAGEASRLLGCSRNEVEQDREAAVRSLQERYGGVAILKGADTLVCHASAGRQQLGRCAHGNAGMASGGMGDVLSGVLGALLAQHLALADSARLGVCIHARAGDLAAAQDGQRGLLASDLFPYIRRLLNP
jgi:ADP-dependent NAD(P)H-hydrate dehydratase / NAD(P)H-hydrate epimerase